MTTVEPDAVDGNFFTLDLSSESIMTVRLLPEGVTGISKICSRSKVEVSAAVEAWVPSGRVGSAVF